MPALESLRTLIKTSTSSMTAVPKPLKFLRPFYQELITTFEGFDETKLVDERVSRDGPREYTLQEELKLIWRPSFRALSGFGFLHHLGSSNDLLR